ncbi:MAG: reverse transcriptase-like protein [Oxalobacteraceae bacterium]|nr:MAG: reverse transcriptase-like protein [Oxalobacteraceae bacterium]
MTYFRDDLGAGTNNDAEWLALLHAVSVARQLGTADVVLVGDAAQVINQANGAGRRRRAEMQRHLTEFQQHVMAFQRVRVRHIG